MTSAEPVGIHWSVRESNTTGWLQSAAWSGSRFVAVGTYGRIMLSPDGISWDSIVAGTPLHLYDVAWSGEQFVAVGCDAAYPHYCIVRSHDGVTWRLASFVPNMTEGLYSIAYSDSMYVAVGYGGQIFCSSDGDLWERQVSPDSMLGKSLYGVTSSDERFVAVGEVWDPATSSWNTMVATSPDGLSWEYQDLGRLGLLFDVTWTGSDFVAVGYTGVWGVSSGLIATSKDGREWTTDVFPSTGYLRAVAAAGRTVIAVGDDGTILTSQDAHEWTSRESGTEMALTGIASSGNRVVVVGISGTILASP
jgi:hypothetical protein